MTNCDLNWFVKIWDDLLPCKMAWIAVSIFLHVYLETDIPLLLQSTMLCVCMPNAHTRKHTYISASTHAHTQHTRATRAHTHTPERHARAHTHKCHQEPLASIVKLTWYRHGCRLESLSTQSLREQLNETGEEDDLDTDEKKTGLC